MIKKYFLYLIRWQLSTPILAICVVLLASLGTTWATIIANFIGGLIFFWVDKWIFSRNRATPKDVEKLMKFAFQTVPYYVPEVWPHNFKSDKAVAHNAWELNGKADELFDSLSNAGKKRWYSILHKETQQAYKEYFKRKKLNLTDGKN